MAKRLVLFNHKGGVSKTTTAYNVGWMFAEQGHRTLLVDADPQCNLSSLILGDNFDEYYLDDSTRLQNMKDGVAPAFTGKPTPIQPVFCGSPARQPLVHLLAGHATLSEYDAALTFAQNSNALATLQNLPGAFHELIRQVEESNDIEYTIIDLNPGLSAINQTRQPENDDGETRPPGGYARSIESNRTGLTGPASHRWSRSYAQHRNNLDPRAVDSSISTDSRSPTSAGCAALHSKTGRRLRLVISTGLFTQTQSIRTAPSGRLTRASSG